MRSKFGHEETKHLGASSGTLFEDDKEFPIYMLKSGKFGVPWGGLFVTRDSLKAIQKAITKLKLSIQGGKFLRIFRDRYDDDDSFDVLDAVEHKGDKIVLRDGKAINVRYSSYYVFDGEVAEQMQRIDLKIKDLQKKIDALKDERDDVLSKLVSVHDGNFATLLRDKGERSK